MMEGANIRPPSYIRRGKMGKKKILYALCLVLVISGCGKGKKIPDQEGSYRINSCLYLEEGLVYDMLGN